MKLRLSDLPRNAVFSIKVADIGFISGRAGPDGTCVIDLDPDVTGEDLPLDTFKAIKVTLEVGSTIARIEEVGD